jgi:hypothetical protein
MICSGVIMQLLHLVSFFYIADVRTYEREKLRKADISARNTGNKSEKKLGTENWLRRSTKRLSQITNNAKPKNSL